MATEDQKSIINEITKQFATAETGLNDAAKAINALAELYEKAAPLRLEGASGTFIVKARAEFRQLAGQIGAIEAPLYSAHAKATSIARNTDEAYKAPDNYATLDGGGR